jgi:hypothetical protein
MLSSLGCAFNFLLVIAKLKASLLNVSGRLKELEA